MRGRNQVGVFALVLAACLYLIGCFWFWSFSPGDWNIVFRAGASILWLLCVAISSASSIFDEKDW